MLGIVCLPLLAPPPPRSAFVFFAQQNFHLVRDKKPDVTSSLITILGHIWTDLSSAEQDPYEKMAAEDKARYDREMAEFR